jgi:hypothetical protein
LTDIPSPLSRTVKLPLGYKATLRFSRETGLVVEWHPGRPQIESNRALRRFLAAYLPARDAFLAEAATVAGVAVVVADVGGVAAVLSERQR